MPPSAIVWRPGMILQALDRTPSNISKIKAALTPAQTLALTAWAEARSRFVPGKGWVANPIAAMTDIMEVVDSRATDVRRRWPADHKSVCLFPWAFSCWEPRGGPDSNHDPQHLADNFEALLDKAQGVIAGRPIVDPLQSLIIAADTLLRGQWAAAGPGELFHRVLPAGTCHYYADWLPSPPAWAFRDRARTQLRQPVAARYGHLFFTGVD